MYPVIVPRLNRVDDTCELVRWLVEPGAPVRAGDPLVEVATEKATFELDADADGIVHPLVAAGSTCRFGDRVAVLFGSVEERAGYLADGVEPAPPAPLDRGLDPVVTGRQAAIARTVTVSHRQIPASFLMAKV